MENGYNFQKHTECMVIHFDDEYLTLKSSLTPINTLETKRMTENYNYKGKACITYDEKKENVLDYGQNPNFELKDEYTHIDQFMEKIRIYIDHGDTWRDDDDIFALKAMSKFLQLSLENSIYYREITRKNHRAFHYIVIIPSEWEFGVREEIIRPLFEKAGVISKKDHEDRLLFYTDLEATFYYLQRRSRNMDAYSDTKLYEKDQENILCRISSDKKGTLSLNLDVVLPQRSTFNVPEAFLKPVSIRSDFASSSLLGFKEDIRNLIESKVSIKSNKIVDLMIDHILNYFSDKTTYWYDRATTYNQENLFWNIDLEDWKLTISQQIKIKALTVSEICSIIDKQVVRALKALLKNSLRTRRTLILAFEYCPPSETQTHPWIPWVEKVLESKEKLTNSKYMPVMMAQEPDSHITLSDLMEETIQMSVNFLYPYVNATLSYVQDKLEASQDHSNNPPSFAYPDLKLDAIINIDISLKSTVVSLSSLNENGDIQEVSHTNSLSSDDQPLPLDKFLDISNITTLKLTKDGFNSIENIFPDYLEYFSKYNRHSKKYQEKEVTEEEEKKIFPAYEERKLYNFSSDLKETLISEIKTILSTDLFFEQDSDSSEQQSNNSQQQKHIRVFLIVYLAYLKDIILKENLGFDEAGLSIGYAVSIERMLLDNTIGTKSDFEEIVSASGIVKSEDFSNFLKIITRGEGLLPLLKQRHMRYEFPIDSYFLLANIYEDYIQFTLNKVVIPDDSENEALSIIIIDKTISIENIYDSLCMNVWDCVVQTQGLIRLCKYHEYQDIYQVQELFSFNARKDFFKSFKSYMSENAFRNTSEDGLTIPLSGKCNCLIYLDTNSMIEIAWKPTLENIATTLSSSLENTNLFGLYYDLGYLFGLIHFNQNPEYQKKIAWLLSAELDSKHIGNGASTRCFIIPEFSDQFLHPKIDHELPGLSAKSFQRGNMAIVSNETYGYSITLPKSGIYDTIVPSKQDKKLGVVPSEIDKERAFLFLKKGDVIDHSGLEKSFSLERQLEDNQKCNDIEEIIRISIFRIRSTDDIDHKNIIPLDDESTIPLDNTVLEKLKIFELTNYKYNCDMPIIITAKYKSHLSSLYFYVKVKGQDVVGQDNYLALNHSTRVVGLKNLQ